MKTYNWAKDLHPVGVEKFIGMVKEMAAYRYDDGDWELNNDLIGQGLIVIDGVSHMMSQPVYMCAKMPTDKWRYAIYDWLCRMDETCSYDDVATILSSWETAKEHLVLHLNAELESSEHKSLKQDWTEYWHMSVCLDVPGESHFCPPKHLFDFDINLDEIMDKAYKNTKEKAELETVNASDAYILYNEVEHVTGLLHSIPELGIPYSEMGVLLAAPDHHRIVALPVENDPSFAEEYDKFVGGVGYMYHTSPWRSSNAAVWWRPHEPIKTLFTDCEHVMFRGTKYIDKEGCQELEELGLINKYLA